MADQLNPRKGGNPLLDQMVDADPTIMNRLMKAGMQPPQEAWKTLYGTDFPNFSLLTGTQDSRRQFIENHGILQRNIMEHLSANALDPLYGASRKSFDEATGEQSAGQPMKFGNTPTTPPTATPNQPLVPSPGISQMPTARSPQPEMPNPLTPSIFSGNYQMGPDESGWEPKGPIRDLNTPQPSGSNVPMVAANLAPPNMPGEDNQPMNSVERAFGSAELKRRSSPYFGMMRGQFANTQAELNAAADALGLEGDDRAAFMARGFSTRAGMYKPTAPEGSNEAENVKAGTRSRNAYADKTERTNKYIDQAQIDKHNDILSKIEARSKQSREMSGLHESLIDLRRSQTAINNAKLHGEMPEQEIAAMEADRKQAKDDLLKQVFVLLDKGKIAPDEAKDIIGSHILQDIGLEAESKPHANIFKQGKEALLGKEPAPEYTPPPKGKAQEMLKQKQRGLNTPAQSNQTPVDAGEHLKALEKELGDISKYEGQTIKDTATGRTYRIQGGKVIEVK